MINNLRWAELLPSVATDMSPFVKSLGKFQNSLGLYGVGTGIAGLEGVNQIIKEVHAAHAVWTRPDQEHAKPSFTRFAFGVLNVTGYGLYGAGAGGFLGRYGTGGGLLLVTASNVLKQHFLPEEKTYHPDNPILPLHRSDIATDVPPAAGRGGTGFEDIAPYARALSPSPSASPVPSAAPVTVPEPNDPWLHAGAMEAGMRRPASPDSFGQVPRPLHSAPVTGAAVREMPTAVNPVAAAAVADLQRRSRSRSLPDLGSTPPTDTVPWQSGSARQAMTSLGRNGARPHTR